MSRPPKVGQWADHKSNALDPREVVRVEKIGGRWWVGLAIGSDTAWPCPASNYTYSAR